MSNSFECCDGCIFFFSLPSECNIFLGGVNGESKCHLVKVKLRGILVRALTGTRSSQLVDKFLPAEQELLLSSTEFWLGVCNKLGFLG